MDLPRDRDTAQTLRPEGSRRPPAERATRPWPPGVPLEDRFNVSRRWTTREYEFRDQPGRVAFRESFRSLRSEQHGGAAVVAMVDRAVERGWDRVRADGSAEFRRQTWIAGSARGLTVVGHEPTPGDREAARNEQRRVGSRLPDRESVRIGPDLQRPAPAGRPAERTGRASGAAVMRALELVMERDGVPQQHRTAIRNLVSSQLAAWQATGRDARLRVVDRAAPRRPQVLPHHELRRAAQERTR